MQYDLCFICDNSLLEGDIVNGVRGFRPVKTASMARKNERIEYLNLNPPCRNREAFNFETLCIFWGHAADETSEMR